MPRARKKAVTDASTSLVESVHDEVLALILAFVPAPDRLRCEEVCKRWRRILTTHDEFTRALVVPFDPQDDSPTVRTADGWTEIREDARDDALLAAVAKSRGRLRHLSLVGCASVTPDAVLAALRSNPEVTRLCMHEGESEEYLLRLRPRDLDALAGAMRERATEEVTPRLEVSVEVAGNRELDALRRLLANASATASAPTAPLAPLVIHGVEIRVVALTFSLLFPDAVLVPHLDDDATDDDDAIARETNAATAKLLADAFRILGPRGLTRVNFGDRSLTDPKWGSSTLHAMAESCASLRELRVDGDSLRAESTRLALNLALSSTSSTLRRLSVRRAWFVGGTLTIPKHSLEQVHLELPTDASLAESAASSGARCVSLARGPDGGGRVSRGSWAADRPIWSRTLSWTVGEGIHRNERGARRLTHFDVGFLDLSLEDMICLVNGARLARLTHLGVASRESIAVLPDHEFAGRLDSDRLVEAIRAHAETLQYLEAGGLPQKVIAGLVRSIPKFDALHTLDLSGTPPFRKKDNDASFAALGEILGDAACGLRRLVLVHCGVVASNLREIGKGAVRSKTLVAVDLSFNSNLGDDGCNELARWIRKTDRLSRLELEACGVGDAGAKHLASAVADRPAFRRLDLASNLGIRKSGRAALAEASNGRPGIWSKETSDDAPWSRGYGTDDDQDDDGDGYFSEDDGYFESHNVRCHAGSRWGELT